LIITFSFKGSIFGQNEDIQIDLEDNKSVNDALVAIITKIPSLDSLIFKEGKLRNDILVLVDKTDIISMNLLYMPLNDKQVITVLPLAHGG